MTRDAAWFIAEAARREKPWEEKIEDSLQEIISRTRAQ